MADKKTVAGKIAKRAFDILYTTPEGQSVMEEIVFSFRGLEPKKTDVKVGHIAAGFSAVRKLDSLYREGLGSKVTVELANMAKDELDLLPSNVQARLLGSLKRPGAEASARVGGDGRVGFKMLDFRDPKTASAFYEDPKTRIDVNPRQVSGRRDFGEFGGFTLSGEAYATKRGPSGKPDMGAMLRGRMPLAKGGTVKKYSNSPRKPRLK